MSRRMYRRSGYKRGPKYSSETSTMNTTFDRTLAQWSQGCNICMIPPTQMQGMRKAKNFTLSFSKTLGDQPVFDTAIAFALVYAPNSLEPSQLNIGTWTQQTDNPQSFYEPNQNVIMSGIIPANTNGRLEFKTRLARNLNSNDSIFLVMKTCTTGQNQQSPCNFSVCVSLNYAICY